MVNRIVNLSQSHSFFLFGARGTGKSTLLKEWVKTRGKVLYIDLLNPSLEDLYRRDPEELIRQVKGPTAYEWVVLDEVQKLPRFLDVVHSLIEERGQKFILSGSSARKLKRGAANLLAGRAFVHYLHPFTHLELGSSFDLDQSLHWGLLPKIINLNNLDEKQEFLRSYALTYLKEEIQSEQIVRQLDPFRAFLEVSAQMNGKIINFSKIARDVGVDTTTVQNYYTILEDTLIGFFLPSFHRSVRRRQRQAPKFFYFDSGVARALTRSLNFPVQHGTSAYGDLFEQFLILEIRKIAQYRRLDWTFSYLLTKDDMEIDLIIDRPHQPLICLEIKSTAQVRPEDVARLAKITADIKKAKVYCFSRDPQPKKIGNVECWPWQDGIRELFSSQIPSILTTNFK